MTARHLFFGALLCCASASWSDATGPTGMVVVTVSPDTIQLSSSGSVAILYRRHTVSSAVRIWYVRLDVESESTQGEWRTVAGSVFLQGALGNAQTTTANGDIVEAQVASLAPGRYRLRYTYSMSGPGATNPSGPESSVVSNVFVVILR
jgi:hypothetical protein